MAVGLTTARLDLRALEPRDAEELRALTDDPAITGTISFLQETFTMADAQALIALNGNGRDLFRGCRRKDGGTLIGVVGSHHHGTDTIEIGYWIGTQFHRQGYASEAAEAVLDQVRAEHPGATIIAECRPDNRASWRILEKLGFRATGEAGERPGRVRLRYHG
jgi:RimJ/RimL family protein N-acetyltransferase